MKKRMLCVALSLCLICFMLVVPAMASHFCCSCDGDAYCDTCYEMMKHTCMFVDDYAVCGKCFEVVEHDCVDEDADAWCDRCFAAMPHTCQDTDGNYWCDFCDEWLEHDCADTDGNYWCDFCDEWLEHDCVDTDGDYWCDLCEAEIYHDCEDSDGDFYCDICYYPVEHECVDEDGDMYCDICYDVVIPEGILTTLGGTAKSGLDALEPVYVDVYDEEDNYINFAILTGNSIEYEMLVLSDYAYIIYASKANHVSRTYTLEVGTDPATLDIKLCPIGDTSGDGKLNMGDVAKLYSHIRGTALIADEYAQACADVSGDGKLNVGDTAALYSGIRATSPF